MTTSDQPDPSPTVIKDCDIGNGERLVWYSMDGLSPKELWDARPERSRQAVVREVPGESPEPLCMGLITWEDGYHYFAGAATGFAIARGLESE